MFPVHLTEKSSVRLPGVGVFEKSKLIIASVRVAYGLPVRGPVVEASLKYAALRPVPVELCAKTMVP